MPELISEPIKPHAASFDAAQMGAGLPGLPKGFDWRGESFEIRRTLGTWKESSREGAQAGGDLYLRRHYYRLEMCDDSIWVAYFTRQTPKSGSPKNRWFLYSVDVRAARKSP